MATETINGKACQASTFCVTGETGFIASWLVKRLLEKGYTVHCTVRDPENKAKVKHLLDISEGGEKLKLFRADLIEEGSFDAAINGCGGVFHVASPVDFAPKDPENDGVKPAVEGTLNVLRSCTKAKTVKRVVVTSSRVTACIFEWEEQNQYIDEKTWTDVDFLRTKKPTAWAYCVAKTLAEQAALQYGKEDAGLDVVSINPVLVSGSAISHIVPYTVEMTLLDVVSINPVLVSGSAISHIVPYTVEMTLSILTGNNQMVEALKEMQTIYGTISLVHINDVCSAHIFLMENPSAEGRYICTAVNISVPQMADYLSKRYPQYNVTTLFDGVPPIPKVYASSKKLVESGFSFKFGMDEIMGDNVEYLKTTGLLL